MDIPSWTLGDRLRKARTAAGFDQRQLTRAIEDLTGDSFGGQNLVSRYESGARNPRGWVIRAWAEVCNVPVGWLRTGEVPPDLSAAQSRWIVQVAGQEGLLAEISS